MKIFSALLLVFSFSLMSEARNRPRDLGEWDEIKDTMDCVIQMRSFLNANPTYLSSPLNTEPGATTVTGVPRRKLRCDDSLIDDLSDGLARCTTDGSRMPYRFEGAGLDCPSHTIKRLRISDSANLEMRLVDKCDTRTRGDLFADLSVEKSPRSISDSDIQQQANQKLEEAIIDIYSKVDLSRAYAGLSRNRIEGIEHQLSQNIFGKVSCSVRHFRDSEVGPVMREAIDRVCGQKRAITGPERCMLGAPENYGTYMRAESAATLAAGAPRTTPQTTLSGDRAPVQPASSQPEIPPAPDVDEDGD